MAKYPEKITIYTTPEQKAWVQALPKSYNLTEKLRKCLDRLISDHKRPEHGKIEKQEQS